MTGDFLGTEVAALFCSSAINAKRGYRPARSLKLNVTIYGDWTGALYADYRMRDNGSNFIIIDKRGIVRFAASGRIDSSRFEAIKKLLLKLATGG